MGYILPIQPIQSQKYANRLNMESYDFAYIDRVNKVKSDLNSAGQKNHYFQQEREAGMPVVQLPPSYQGFVYPNPVKSITCNCSSCRKRYINKFICLTMQ